MANLNSAFLASYSIGMFYVPALGDRIPRNRAFFLIYTLIALMQVYLGLLGRHAPGPRSSWPFYLEKVLDGTFQSFAWPTNFSILCNWFPKQGRGMLIGIWATCPSVGDIVGQQLFVAIVGNNINTWNKTFYVLGGIVFIIGLVNLVFLVEYPKNVGLEVKEKGKLLNPDQPIRSPYQNRNSTTVRDPNTSEVIEEDSDPEDSESIPAMPFMKALLVEGVLAFSFSFFFIKFCYYGVYYWVPTYL